MTEAAMTIRERLSLAYTRRIVKTPAGRAFILRQLAEAESNGEAAIFDRLLCYVDDAKLQRMIAKHQEDEVRHARLYAEAAARQGVPDEPVPPELRLIDRLDRAIGGLRDRRIADAKDIMEIYLLLQVIEERGITQFRILSRAFREVDPETADLIDVVAADEERHLKYCHAIARRYAPGPETMAATLTHFRTLEARVFAEQMRFATEYAMAHGYFSGGPVEKALFRGLIALTRRSGELPYTPYATAPRAVATTATAGATTAAAA
jgi:rubrerythrin